LIAHCDPDTVSIYYMTAMLALVLSSSVILAAHTESASSSPREVGRTECPSLLQKPAVTITKLFETEVDEASHVSIMHCDSSGDAAPRTKRSNNDQLTPHVHGRWLFGSLTCPLDHFAVDQMLPHQLRQSTNRSFDHRILYASPHHATAEQRRQHDEMLAQVRSEKLVDEIINTSDLIPLELARRSMREDIARSFVTGNSHSDYQAVMLSFLARCLDGYDHCAWLDGDIFVHQGSVPWVDESVKMHTEDPQRLISKGPWDPTSQSPQSFGSRYFVYHMQALQHLLPLDGNSTGTFEDVINDNFERRAKECVMQGRPGHIGGSWVIHPPDPVSDIDHILEGCGPGHQGGLTALIAIVEQGREHGDTAYEWRDIDNFDEMDVQNWTSHVHQHCQSLKASELDAYA